MHTNGAGRFFFEFAFATFVNILGTWTLLVAVGVLLYTGSLTWFGAASTSNGAGSLGGPWGPLTQWLTLASFALLVGSAATIRILSIATWWTVTLPITELLTPATQRGVALGPLSPLRV